MEEVIAIIARQQKPAPRWRRLYLAGFSLWKRALYAGLLPALAEELCFVRKPPKRLTGDEQVLVWAVVTPSSPRPFRVEDGFIRSQGLTPTCVALFPVAGSGRDLFRQPQPQRPRAVAQLPGADPVTSSTRVSNCSPCCAKTR